MRRRKLSYHNCLVIGMLLCGINANSQQTEYRITEGGQYQYLSSREQAGMVYDESIGSFYKSITVRTFFLETQRKGYMPSAISYEEFLKLTPDEQRNIVKQPRFDIECSSSYLSPECMEFRPASVSIPKDEKSRVIDLTPKCGDAGRPLQEVTLPLTLQLLLKSDSTIVNTNCEDGGVKATQETDADGIKQNRIRNVKMILGKD